MNRIKSFGMIVFALIVFVGTLAQGRASAASAKSGNSGIEVGAGINSLTGGRTIPSLELSYQLPEQEFSWASTGVKSKYYYQSSHLLFYFRTWTAGTMWGGDITTGFGGGAGYSVREFQDEASTSGEKATDFLLGPAMHLNWSFGPIYIKFSTLFGLRDWQKHLLGLNFQDVESLTLGFRF